MELRVWSIINPPGKPTYYPVATPEAGAKLIDQLIRQQLRQPTITSNVFGLEEREGDEWFEWQNEKGLDVEEAFEAILS